MTAQYRKAIVCLRELLRRLEENASELNTLLAIQRELVLRLKRAEKRVVHWRKAAQDLKVQLRTGRLPKVQTEAIRKRLKSCHDALDWWQQQKFVLRCFGDGIAFVYLDKFSLKHAFFRTNVYEPKQEPGDLSGKAALRREWSVVKVLVKHGVPAMLCDITNVLRHGDVCVLVGPDPLPIEVKSSENSNARVERQINSLKQLGEFLANDEARNFRGVPWIKRQGIDEPDVTHIEAINRVLQESGAKGSATLSPEPGLHYLCVRQDDVADAFPAEWRDKKLEACVLNRAKSAGDWGIYYPFTLSIRDPDHLYEFITGQYVVVVALDIDELAKQFTECGLQVAMPREGAWAVWLRRKDGAVTAVSRTLLDRVFYEFQSLSWFVRMNSRMTDKIASSGESSVPPDVPPMIGPQDVGPLSDLPEWVRATLRSEN